MAISQALALKDLAFLESSAKKLDFTDFVVSGMTGNIPADICIALESLWKKTKKIGGQVISIGKIIVIKIIEFIREHPNFSLGVAIGAAIGALSNLIPLIGSFLAPLAMAAGAFLGGVYGIQFDKVARGEKMSTSILEYFGDIMDIAMQFFAKLADIINYSKLLLQSQS